VEEFFRTFVPIQWISLSSGFLASPYTLCFGTITRST
jgi:hypothetical protein